MGPITDEQIRNVVRSHHRDASVMEVLGGLLDRIQDLQRRVSNLEPPKD